MTRRLDDFLDLSVTLTCFTRFELLGTGQAETYAGTAEAAAGEAFDDLLRRFQALPAGTGRAAALRRDILGDEFVGPVARAIIKMWYIGIWYEMPRGWTEKYGARRRNASVMVSPAAYAEGLLWPAIGAHPPGAKAPGYGSWAMPPAIPAFTCALEAGEGGGADAGPTIVQAEEGHVAPHHAPKSQHPPPPPGDLPR